MAQINDEYDVQDLLRGILAGLFGDVRGEQPTPSRAGLASRMDLYLKNEQIVIETKMTRSGLTQRKVAEQLAVDKELYRSEASWNRAGWTSLPTRISRRSPGWSSAPNSR
jgi:hypothetical protein